MRALFAFLAVVNGLERLYAAYSHQERALAVQRKQRFAGLVAGEAAEGETTQKQELELKVDAGRVSYRLNREQMRTLRLLARGLSTAELASELKMTRAGAWGRVDTILRRFGASNVTEACVKAAQAGLLDGLLAEEEKESQEKRKRDDQRRRITEARQKRAGRRWVRSHLQLIKGGNS